MRIATMLLACALAAANRSPDTIVRRRYDDGRLAELRPYSNGEKDGLHRGWWPNGNPRFACRYDDGRAVGTCREWYASGRLATVHRYRAGVEDGLQQGWSAQGSPQFSYVVRDGRRFGLLGTMNCKSGARAPGAL